MVSLKSILKKIIGVYKGRRNLMLELFDEIMPEGVTWTRPEGGLFLWIRLPEGVDSIEVFDDAIKEKVAFVPGSAFFVDDSGKKQY